MIRASLASQVFFLWLDRKVSEEPLRAPATPELLPDWSRTTQIRKMLVIRMMMVKTHCAMVIGQNFLSKNRPARPRAALFQVYELF